MNNTPFNIEKIKAVMLFIAEKIENPDLFTVFKILYLAEKNHLSRYGCLIIEDTYYAMKNGPVPSFVYDLFKGIRGDGFIDEKARSFYNAFDILDTYKIITKESPNLDFISRSNAITLSNAIKKYSPKDFVDVREDSHDSAWDKAGRDNSIKYSDIAIAGGANKNMMDFIEEYFENLNLAIS